MRQKESAAGLCPAARFGLGVSTPAHAPSVPRNGHGCQARVERQSNPTLEPGPAQTLTESARLAAHQAEQCERLAEACAAAGDDKGRWYWLRKKQLHLAEVWAASHPPDSGERPTAQPRTRKHRENRKP